MKKTLLTLAAVAAASCASYGQGYFTFQSTSGIFDDFTTAGTPTKDGNMYVDFIYASGTSQIFSALGSSASAAGTISAANNPWAALSALSADSTGTVGGWDWFSASEIAKTGATPPPAVGQYSDGVVDLTGLASGDVISLYAIAWNDAYSTVQAAATAGAAVGWSQEINVTLGSSTAQAGQLGTPGGAFDVDVVTSGPEPTTIALAGLGGLSMLFLRRRKA